MRRGNKWDELMTIVFMILAVLTVVFFFVAPQQSYFLIFGGTAVVLRIVQYTMRLIR